MMTCVSLRSGMASRGTVTIAHHPAMQATAMTASIASLCSTEKSMIRLIIRVSLALAGGVPSEVRPILLRNVSLHCLEQK